MSSGEDERATGPEHPASDLSADEVCTPPADSKAARPQASTRDMILARRSRFIAAALAGAGLASTACGDAGPQVCLSPVLPIDGGSGEGGFGGGPEVCLSGNGPGGAGGAPQVCLSGGAGPGAPTQPMDAGGPEPADAGDTEPTNAGQTEPLDAGGAEPREPDGGL